MLPIWYFVLVLNILIFSSTVCEELNDEDACCPQIFLQSRGILADSQSLVLGIYTISSQRLANTPHPVYVKHGPLGSTHVYFRENSEGPRGWIVGGELLEDSYYITTGQESECPVGIVGGFDVDDKTKYDNNFSIECHTDQVTIPCCTDIEFTSEGAIKTNNFGVLGKYKQAGEFNGRPLYKGGHADVDLYFRKAGSGPDGWVIGINASQDMFMVTTRNMGYCPDEIRKGYEQDGNEDATVNFICSVEVEQDPGLPSQPLANEDESSGMDPKSMMRSVGEKVSERPRQGRQGDAGPHSGTGSLFAHGTALVRTMLVAQLLIIFFHRN